MTIQDAGVVRAERNCLVEELAAMRVEQQRLLDQLAAQEQDLGGLRAAGEA